MKRLGLTAVCVAFLAGVGCDSGGRNSDPRPADPTKAPKGLQPSSAGGAENTGSDAKPVGGGKVPN